MLIFDKISLFSLRQNQFIISISGGTRVYLKCVLVLLGRCYSIDQIIGTEKKILKYLIRAKSIRSLTPEVLYFYLCPFTSATKSSPTLRFRLNRLIISLLKKLKESLSNWFLKIYPLSSQELTKNNNRTLDSSIL